MHSGVSQSAPAHPGSQTQPIWPCHTENVPRPEHDGASASVDAAKQAAMMMCLILFSIFPSKGKSPRKTHVGSLALVAATSQARKRSSPGAARPKPCLRSPKKAPGRHYRSGH